MTFLDLKDTQLFTKFRQHSQNRKVYKINNPIFQTFKRCKTDQHISLKFDSHD